MSRSFRLTRRAEDSLVDIALWTLETFGERQAEIYRDELISRCEAIAAGRAHARPLAGLLPEEPEADRLFYARTGEHFVVWLETEKEAPADAPVLIIDFIHGRSDLPRRLAGLDLVGD
ncbi:MAG: type II toxin-antitoxin system RelE/ParE family toxin [Pseudomonadota bacterium]